MPRLLSIALITALCLAFTASADEPDATKLPAVKKALDKAEAVVRRNRKAYDEANTKAVAEAEKELKNEVDRLSRAGKPEEAVAVKKLLESVGASVVAKAEKKVAPLNPAQAGAVAWNGHKYKYIADKLTWPDEKAKCEEMGGHLLIIDDRAEQDFVTQSLNALGGRTYKVWLGITHGGTPGQWRTLNGGELTFTNWAPGEPNGGRDAPAAYLLLEWGGRWDDAPGFPAALSYICEWDD